ncbi:MAG: M48 family peptidase [Pedobacter sp.]|nr:MAG: M48 family peptidase [Pedobacter sp.]
MIAGRGSINLGTREIDFNLSFAERKSLSIKVMPTGEVKVIAPITATHSDVIKKIKTKVAWIVRQQNFFQTFQPGTPPRKFINGETHLYLGRQYKLRIIKNAESQIRIYRGTIEVYTRDITSTAVRHQLNEWYKIRGKAVLYQLFEEALSLNPRFQSKDPRLSIKAMEKRWGSCTPNGRITLNSKLIHASKACISYIIIHELCHLLHPNHTKAFYRLLSTKIPAWERTKLRLEQIMA